MNINSLQGQAAYNNTAAPQAVDNAQLRNQNLEAARTELNEKDTQATRDAFEVNLSREALETRSAQNRETSEAAAETRASSLPEENQSDQSAAGANSASQIVNIVA